jgi:2-polyprenyl-6-methoxyphenol hydroxylase-like FAD-dependent oxidoreductase
MSGLFAAILLRRAGWEVDVYERVDVGLIGRGAGIVTHAEMRAVLRAAGCDPSADFGVEITMRRTLDRSGACVGEYACPQTSTSWDRVFRMLRQQFPDAHYHIGKELQRIEQAGDRVVAHFADGTAAEGDLLVAADGFRSNVRAAVLPEVKPAYAGYIGWRGVVDESALPPAVHADVFEAMVFGLPPNEQFISYPVAGRDNDLRPGHRRCNFVWYRPADEATELRRLLTDASGRFHALGIPPPLVRAEIIASLRQESRTLLAPQLDAVVSLTPQPFLQPIFDVETTAWWSGGSRSSATPPTWRGRTSPPASPRRRKTRWRSPMRCARTATWPRRSRPSSASAFRPTGASCNAAAISAAISSRICWRRRRWPTPSGTTRPRRS